jgi:hypothetical protein
MQSEVSYPPDQVKDPLSVGRFPAVHQVGYSGGHDEDVPFPNKGGGKKVNMDTYNIPKIMNWRIIGLATLVVWMLLISACQAESISFRPPNLKEIQDFSKDQGINPIVDKLLDDSVVLLYEKGASFGYYVLAIREPDGELVVSSNVSVPKSDQPILIIQQKSGDEPFMAVVIQDVTLLADTTAIEIFIDSQNRLTSTLNNQKGAILWSPSPIDDWRTVTLYNAQGETIYSQEGP